MGWKQYMRQLEKQAARAQAESEVEQFESYLTALVSLHKECGMQWDWRAVGAAPAPTEPLPTHEREVAARAALNGYKPGFFQRLLGDGKQQQALEQAVHQAATADAAQNKLALDRFREVRGRWEVRAGLAPTILRRDASVFARALHHAGSFVELERFQTEVVVEEAEPDVVALSGQLRDEELVPQEELKLTAGGKVSKKAIPAGRYWSLHQDHVCSAAIRAARETFAVLPVSRAIVNITTGRINPTTGHPERVTILGVNFMRDVLASLNLDAIDPSDSMKNFPHRMKFKKTSGFEPVDPVTIQEQWVTSS